MQSVLRYSLFLLYFFQLLRENECYCFDERPKQHNNSCIYKRITILSLWETIFLVCICVACLCTVSLLVAFQFTRCLQIELTFWNNTCNEQTNVGYFSLLTVLLFRGLFILFHAFYSKLIRLLVFVLILIEAFWWLSIAPVIAILPYDLTR